MKEEVEPETEIIKVIKTGVVWRRGRMLQPNTHINVYVWCHVIM